MAMLRIQQVAPGDVDDLIFTDTQWCHSER